MSENFNADDSYGSDSNEDAPYEAGHSAESSPDVAQEEFDALAETRIGAILSQSTDEMLPEHLVTELMELLEEDKSPEVQETFYQYFTVERTAPTEIHAVIEELN